MTDIVSSAHEGGEFPRFSALKLLFNGLQIAGTVNGSPTEMREMLDLAVRKNIKPWIQVMPMEKANQALLDLEAGKPRYRLVLALQIPKDSGDSSHP